MNIPVVLWRIQTYCCNYKANLTVSTENSFPSFINYLSYRQMFQLEFLVHTETQAALTRSAYRHIFSIVKCSFIESLKLGTIFT